MPKVTNNSYDRANKRAFQIRTAAYELITEIPFADITMTMIAERAQVAKGTIFNYFKNKEDIFMAISINGYLHYIERMEQALDQAVITTKAELKEFLLEQTRLQVREYSVVILITSLRHFSLEVHADPEQTLQGRARVYKTLDRIANKMAQAVPKVDVDALNHAFVIQGSILNGLLNFANMNIFNNIECPIEMPGATIDIEVEATYLFGMYLDNILKL